MKRAPRSRQRHDLYAKYHDYDSEISDLLGECGFKWSSRLSNKPWFVGKCEFDTAYAASVVSISHKPI